jgi:hypothetical protein
MFPLIRSAELDSDRHDAICAIGLRRIIDELKYLAIKIRPLSIVGGKAYTALRNAWIVPFI